MNRDVVIKYVPAPSSGPIRPRMPYHTYDEDGDISMTADTWIDDPRQPTMEPTGVLNAAGDMIMRITMPVKLKCGFHTTVPAPVDTVQYLAAAEDLSITEDNTGVGWVTHEEALAIDPDYENVEDDVPEEGEPETEIAGLPVVGTTETGKPVVKMSDVIRKLTAEGIAVALDLDENGQPRE